MYEALFQLVGERGASEAALNLKAFDYEKQIILVKCSLKSHQTVIASLALKKSFRREEISIRLQRIYGTLEKAKKAFPSLNKSKG